ncbi:hypothetical protein MASR2M17_21790 [Aminivibrio sp.]
MLPPRLTVGQAAGSNFHVRGVLDLRRDRSSSPRHSHPDVVRAIGEKASRYAHLSNYFLDPDARETAEILLSKTGRKGEVYFANSGTEANEAALKAVKKNRKGPSSPSRETSTAAPSGPSQSPGVPPREPLRYT